VFFDNRVYHRPGVLLEVVPPDTVLSRPRSSMR